MPPERIPKHVIRAQTFARILAPLQRQWVDNRSLQDTICSICSARSAEACREFERYVTASRLIHIVCLSVALFLWACVPFYLAAIHRLGIGTVATIITALVMALPLFAAVPGGLFYVYQSGYISVKWQRAFEAWADSSSMGVYRDPLKYNMGELDQAYGLGAIIFVYAVGLHMTTLALHFILAQFDTEQLPEGTAAYMDKKMIERSERFRGIYADMRREFES